MIKKKLLLADQDSEYMREFSYYFMEQVPQFELVMFTKADTLLQYLYQEGPGDVLVLDEKFANEEIKALAPDMTRIVLSAKQTPPEGFLTVKKYQKLSDLANQILMYYAEAHDALEFVRGSSSTRMIAFYSPAGGSGKTTLALGTAAAGARMGLRCFYLNLEEIDSVRGLLEQTEGGLSDLFLALNTKGMNAGIRLKASVRQEPLAGFDYLSGVESISEYEEIREENIRELLKMIRNLSSYDLVIIDLSSGFSALTRTALKEADQILVPFSARESHVAKLSRLLAESSLHDHYDALFRKMCLFVNDVYGRGGGVPEEISGRIPCCGSIGRSPVLENWHSLLREGEQMAGCIGPVIQLVRKDS